MDFGCCIFLTNKNNNNNNNNNNKKMEKIDERTLWRIIDTVSEEYLESKGYGGGGKIRDSPAFVVDTAGKGKGSASSSEGEEDKAEATDESSSTTAADDSMQRAAGELKKTLRVFREECFLPCYMSNAEAVALMFLSDSFAASCETERVAPLLSAVYCAHYNVPLPQDIQGGITDYVRQVKAGSLPQTNWFGHASAFLAMYSGDAWKSAAAAAAAAALRHEAAWESALHSPDSHKWSTFFHALHALNAAPNAQLAKRFVKTLSVGGFSNRVAIANLHQSLESERAEKASAERLLMAARSVLKQAELAVESVAAEGDDLVALFVV
jgi:hypothetical protein